MPTFSTIIHTLFYRFLLTLLFLVSAPLVLVMMLLPARIRYRSKLLFKLINLFCWAVIKASCVPVTFEGREHIPDEPIIFAANHQSSVDIPLVAVLARGKPHVWLATQILMKGKLLRWVVPRLAVMVDTSSREKAMRSTINLVRLAKKTHVDIMIFPEGARFPDDKVHPFYGGFVTLAKMLKRPVVPVYISGANKVYPPKTFWIHRYPIQVTVGKPFEMGPDESDAQFKDRVHNWFVKESEG